MQQKLFQNFLPQEARAFGHNMEKDSQTLRPKLKKNVCYIFTENICSACSLIQVVIFCKNVSIL